MSWKDCDQFAYSRVVWGSSEMTVPLINLWVLLKMGFCCAVHKHNIRKLKHWFPELKVIAELTRCRRMILTG